MKTFVRTSAMLSFAWFLALTLAGSNASAQAARTPGSATGTVTHKGMAMPATHSVAVWNEMLSTLNVYLLGAAPSAAETKGLQEGDWRVLIGKPYVSIHIRWAEKGAIGRLDQASVDAQVLGIAGADEHAQLSWMEGEAKQAFPTFTGRVKSGTVTLASTTDQKDSEVAWNVTAMATVLPSR